MSLELILAERHLTLVFPDFNILVIESVARQFETLAGCLDTDVITDQIEVPVSIDRQYVEDLFRWCLMYYLDPKTIKMMPLEVMLGSLELIKFLHHTALIDNYYPDQLLLACDYRQYPILGQFAQYLFLKEIGVFRNEVVTQSVLESLVQRIKYLPNYVDLVRPFFIDVMSMYVGRLDTFSMFVQESPRQLFKTCFYHFPGNSRLIKDARIMAVWSKIFTINQHFRNHCTQVELTTHDGVKFSIELDSDTVKLVGTNSTKKHFFQTYPIEECTVEAIDY